MIQRDTSPFCSMADAASYLGFEDAQTLDAKLTKSENFQPGKIRYRVMADGSKRRKIRL